MSKHRIKPVTCGSLAGLAVVVGSLGAVMLVQRASGQVEKGEPQRIQKEPLRQLQEVQPQQQLLTPAYEVKRKDWVVDRRSGSFYLRAHCSPGNRVVGGGFSLGTSQMEAVRSFPIHAPDASQPQGWEVYVVDNSQSKDYSAHAYAICMKLSG